MELKIYDVKQDVTLITYPSLSSSSTDDSTQSPYQKGFPVFSVLPQKYHLYHIYYLGNLFNIFSFKQSLNLILCLPSGPLAIYFQWNTFLAQEIPYHACFSWAAFLLIFQVSQLLPVSWFQILSSLVHFLMCSMNFIPSVCNLATLYILLEVQLSVSYNKIGK